MKGCRKVAVKENVAASRERFSVMTAVQSWRPKHPPDIAVMFKVSSGNGCRVASRLPSPARTLIQFSEKGSYRLEHVLRFLEWAAGAEGQRRNAAAAQAAAAPAVVDGAADVGAAAEAAAEVAAPADVGAAAEAAAEAAAPAVVVLDWFAPHLHPDVDVAMHKAGVAVLRIGGGLTPDVQVGDTHRHGPLTRIYRQLETADAAAQLRLRPHQVPSVTRTSVLLRTVDAWKQTDHSCSEQEWLQNGITNALDGSEDGDIRSELVPLWEQLRIPELRQQIVREVRAEVAAGRLHSFWQYPELLEKYDDHAGEGEGFEDAERVVVSESEASAGAIDIEDEAVEGGESCPGEPVPPVAPDDKCAEVAKAALIDPDLALRAEAELSADAEGKRIKGLVEAASVLRSHGNATVAESLEEKARGLAKQTNSCSSATRLYLRAQALQRSDDAASARAAAEEEDRQLKRTKAQIKLAQLEAEKAKTSASVEKAKAKHALEELKQSKLDQLQERERQDRERVHFRRCFAHHLIQTLKDFFGDFTAGDDRQARAVETLRVSLKSSAAKVAECPATPLGERCGASCIEVTNAAWLGAKVSRKDKQYASEKVARLLYNGKMPEEATTAESVWSRLEKILHSTMPGYRNQLAGRFSPKSLLERQGGYVDAAIFAAVWTYSSLLGPKVLPCGLHSWPLEAEARAKFFQTSGFDGGMSAPGGVAKAASSSAGSGAVKGGELPAAPAAKKAKAALEMAVAEAVPKCAHSKATAKVVAKLAGKAAAKPAIGVGDSAKPVAKVAAKAATIPAKAAMGVGDSAKPVAEVAAKAATIAAKAALGVGDAAKPVGKVAAKAPTGAASAKSMAKASVLHDKWSEPP